MDYWKEIVPIKLTTYFVAFFVFGKYVVRQRFLLVIPLAVVGSLFRGMAGYCMAFCLILALGLLDLPADIVFVAIYPVRFVLWCAIGGGLFASSRKALLLFSAVMTVGDLILDLIVFENPMAPLFS